MRKLETILLKMFPVVIVITSRVNTLGSSPSCSIVSKLKADIEQIGTEISTAAEWRAKLNTGRYRQKLYKKAVEEAMRDSRRSVSRMSCSRSVLCPLPSMPRNLGTMCRARSRVGQL
jgi:hypothetical protein